ncbi:MAG: ABC transporter permease subunit [Parvibaculaceae bacterium]
MSVAGSAREGSPALSRRLLTGDRLFRAGALGLTALLLFVFVAFPIWAILREGFVLADGTWGFGNFIDYFRDPRFLTITGRSLLVAVSATVITVVLAYGFAYALVRTAMPCKGLFRFAAFLPVFAPSLVQALGVQFLLGRNGLVSNLLGIRLDIYGFWGILISDVVYAFPHAVLIIVTALSVTDGRLYEAGRMLGASEFRLFRTVTVPASRYGVMSAAFVVFTIVITDFGNAMVIGGDYSVLATEIYNQVSGQANFRLGAVIGIVLLIPAALAMFVERLVARRNTALLSERSAPLVLRKSALRDACALAYAALICGLILLIVGIVVLASFVKLWPYDVTLTVRHYVTDVQNGYAPLWTSLWMSLIAAVLGTALVVLHAYMIEKVSHPFTRILYFLSILPAAVPGMVLGLGYILAFNDPANPVYWLYGTVWLLAINTIFHYHAQAFLIATTNIKQISRTFDEASAMLGATFLRTMARIALPLLLPSLLNIGLFLFMRAMVTLSAVIFLVSPRNTVAAVSVLLLDDSGKASQAAAFSVVIMVVVLAVSAGFNLLLRIPLARQQIGHSPAEFRGTR